MFLPASNLLSNYIARRLHSFHRIPGSTKCAVCHSRVCGHHPAETKIEENIDINILNENKSFSIRCRNWQTEREFTLPKMSINMSWMLKLGLNGPSVCCRASRATRKTLLVISPEKTENKIRLIAS